LLDLEDIEVSMWVAEKQSGKKLFQPKIFRKWPLNREPQHLFAVWI